LLHFGWGKPVPINLYNFKRPKRDYLLSSLAGPAANLLMAGACLALMHLTRYSYAFGPGGRVWMSLGHVLLMLLALINVILAVINLLPVPPLDGSKIWPCLIPGMKPTLRPRTTWFFILLLIFALHANALEPMFEAAVAGVSRVAPVSDAQRFEDSDLAGWQAIQGQQYAQAEAHFTAALAINRWSGETFAGRGLALAKQQRWNDALNDLNRAVELGYGQPEAYESRARVLERLGLEDQARSDRMSAEAMRASQQGGQAAQDRPAGDTKTSPGSPVDTLPAPQE
jgi:tetratricopeptide (TPR) repeat protein